LAEAVFGRKDWSQLSGDKEFVTNGFAPAAFSKLRVSIAGLYQWRLMDHPTPADKARLEAAADYAFMGLKWIAAPLAMGSWIHVPDLLVAERKRESLKSEN